MDFFDELSQALQRDGARRGVRSTPEVWQRFNSRIEAPRAAAPVQEETFEPENAVIPPAVAEIMEQSVIESAPVQANTCTACQANGLPDDWDALKMLALNCRNCHLAAGRQNVVFGEGALNARLMFIGEGPGADEDATGRPFVGAAGQLLDKMIAAMHLAREEVYIANIVKCRPPGNRMPGDDEAAACMGYLEKQIELLKPEVIVLLGGTALRFLLHVDGITKMRGRWLEYKNIAVMPTFHPAFLLRKPEAKREAWHDLKLVMAKLGIAL